MTRDLIASVQSDAELQAVVLCLANGMTQAESLRKINEVASSPLPVIELTGTVHCVADWARAGLDEWFTLRPPAEVCDTVLKTREELQGTFFVLHSPDGKLHVPLSDLLAHPNPHLALLFVGADD